MAKGNTDKISTGIAGLDKIARGGLPPANLYLLQGAAGAGKTTAALQFLRAGVAAGERCVYVTLSQTKAELNAIAKSHGWTLKGIKIEELSASEDIASAADQSIFQTADLRLEETRESIERLSKTISPTDRLRFSPGDLPDHRRHSAVPPRVDRSQGVSGAARDSGAPARYPTKWQ